MNQNKSIKTLLIVILVAAVAVAGYFVLVKKPTKTTLTPTTGENQILYTNSQYGFSVSLPESWQGYSIIASNWQGEMIEEPSKTLTGPKILIRHPLWTAENPRQDIPVMVFTPEEWNLVQQEKISLGAAPIGPSVLGHNTNYYFALPARYNFAYQTGFEEVQKIIEGNSFKAF